MAKWVVEYIHEHTTEDINRDYCHIFGITNGKAIAEDVYFQITHNEHIKGIKVRKVDDRKKATYTKCGSCKWLNLEKKTKIGCECENPAKEFRTPLAMYKYKHTPACKLYEEREEAEECSE